MFATFLEGSTIVFLFLFKRRNVFYDGMKSEAKEMTNGRNIEKNLTVVKKKTTSKFDVSENPYLKGDGFPFTKM